MKQRSLLVAETLNLNVKITAENPVLNECFYLIIQLKYLEIL